MGGTERRQRGGLVLFWKSTVNLKIEGSHRYYIDATKDKDMENEWRLTGFYGELETNRRWKAWDKLWQFVFVCRVRVLLSPRDE